MNSYLKIRYKVTLKWPIHSLCGSSRHVSSDIFKLMSFVRIQITLWCFFACVLFQMKELIMNQEKLAKLQAQVRIGGKVRCSKCWQLAFGKKISPCWPFFWIMVCIKAQCCACRGQHAERRRLFTGQQQQMTRSSSSPSRNWESTTFRALRR